MSSTTTRSKIGSDDLNFWDGVSDTYTRLTSTGGALTLNKIGYLVDVLEAYGSGTTYTRSIIQSAVEAIGTTNKRGLLLRPGTWIIDDDLTIPSNFTLIFFPGTILIIYTGKTLTVNGLIEADLYQIFSLVGTGAVSGLKFARPEWFATNTTPGTTDMTAAFTAAQAAAQHVLLAESSYSLTSVTVTKDLIGPGREVCTLYGNGSGNTLQIGSGSTQLSYRKFQGFTVDHSNNTAGSDICCIYMKGITQCEFQDIEVIGKTSVTKYGWRGEAIDGSGTGIFSNRWTFCRATGDNYYADSYGWSLEGQTGSGANINHFANCFSHYWAYGFYIKDGHGNDFLTCKVLNGSDNNQLFAWVFYDSGTNLTNDNCLINCSFDSLPDGKKIKLVRDYEGTGESLFMLTAIGCRNLEAGVDKDTGVVIGSGKITSADPAVLTVTGHGLETGDSIWISSITQGDWDNLNKGLYTITKVTDDTFSIRFDASAYAAYTDAAGKYHPMKYPIVLDGTVGTGNPPDKIISYSLIGRGGVISNQKPTTFSLYDGRRRALIAGGQRQDSLLELTPHNRAIGGRILLAGEDYVGATGVQPGGIGIILDGYESTADFRIGWTPQGEEYSNILTIDKNSIGLAMITSGTNSVTVTNERITANSIVLVTPKTDYAGDVMSDQGYRVTLNAGVSFSIDTADGANAANNSWFFYFIVKY